MSDLNANIVSTDAEALVRREKGGQATGIGRKARLWVVLSEMFLVWATIMTHRPAPMLVVNNRRREGKGPGARCERSRRPTYKVGGSCATARAP